MSIHRLSRATLLITARVEQTFTKKGMYLRRVPYADIALGALLRSVCETSRSIIILARAGCGVNALALSRSAIENWITLRWLTNKDTDRRVRKFLGFDSKQRERIIQLIAAHYPSVNLDRYTGNKLHDRRAAEYKHWDSWGPRIKQMAEEDELVDAGLTGATSPKWAYDVQFFVSSYYFHPTPLGLYHHFQQAGDVFRVERGSHESDMATQALINASLCVALSALRLARFWGFEDDIGDEVTAVWNRFVDPIGRA